jgi:hypothetical protein
MLDSAGVLSVGIKLAWRGLVTFAWAATFASASTASGGPLTLDLTDRFASGWRESWREQGFPFTRPTLYAVESDGPAGPPVLRATSSNGNRALLRPVRVTRPTHARLSWRWKIAAPLATDPARHDERTRAGDDYAARVFVVFERSILPTRTVAINYVWATHEPVGATYPSPYTERVRLIVLRTGATSAGAWQTESRDILADYHAAFGRDARELHGVALMTDTDDTGTTATAWFDAVTLEINPLPADS